MINSAENGFDGIYKSWKDIGIVIFFLWCYGKVARQKGTRKKQKGARKNMTNYQNRDLYKLQAAADVQRRARTGARKR